MGIKSDRKWEEGRRGGEEERKGRDDKFVMCMCVHVCVIVCSIMCDCVFDYV